MKHVIIVPHAEEELKRRRIPRDVFLRTVHEPQQIVPSYAGRKVYQSLVEMGDGKEYVFRVIVEETADTITVITVYKTSQVDKYWRSQ